MESFRNNFTFFQEMGNETLLGNLTIFLDTDVLDAEGGGGGGSGGFVSRSGKEEGPSGRPASPMLPYRYELDMGVQIGLYSAIFLLAVIGNSLVILTLVQNQGMRTITNLFLLNLAIADLLVGVFCMPFTLVGIVLKDFVFGSFLCKLIPYLQGKLLYLLLYLYIYLSTFTLTFSCTFFINFLLRLLLIKENCPAPERDRERETGMSGSVE